MADTRSRDDDARANARRDGEDDVEPGAQEPLTVPSQPFLASQLGGRRARGGGRRRIGRDELRASVRRLGIEPTVDEERVRSAVAEIEPQAEVTVDDLPEEVLQSLRAPGRRFHGAKFTLAYFPGPRLRSRCADRFGYLSSRPTRKATRLPFDADSRARLVALGSAMAAPGRDAGPDSTLPAGFTYVGQFVDHDVTFDVSSSLDVDTDARTIHNMRSPSLDLDSVYGRGPALDPFLYVLSGTGNATAFKLRLGTNTPSGPGGPGGAAGAGGMVEHADRDVPRMGAPDHTAVIGDPRNDENLVVVQLHHAMLRFHNAVVDLLELAGFTGDVFVEAKRMVTHHYQWAVVDDFLRRVCGSPAVDDALASVTAPVGSPFRMPVEFSVAAYRFGHSMIRDRYWVNFNFTGASLGDVFAFNRPPNLPVLSGWVVDLNAFFETGVPVPVFNFARKIDSALANGLAFLPGLTALMAELATRNLLRGLALGLPSGQGMAQELGVPVLTAAELTQGLPADEVAVLNDGGGVLLDRTPLWYYVLREAAVLEDGERLGPVGARIVAETFVRMLKRDQDSFLNVTGAFFPTLPSMSPAPFTFADLLAFSGATQP